MKEFKNKGYTKRFERTYLDFYKNYKNITLPPEYSYILENDLMQLLIQLARYKFVARMLSPQDQVLEIGCGSGLGSIFLSQYCKSVKGIDINKREIFIAKSINLRKNVIFEVNDFFKYPKNLKYDCLVAIDVIEHLTKSCGTKFISYSTELLSNNGMFILGTPSCYSYKYQGKLSKAAHAKLYDQQELIRLMEKYYRRVIAFSMNDELVHTGFSKLVWYYFLLAFVPKVKP